MAGQLGQKIHVGARDFGGHASALPREEQCQEIEHRQLRSKTFRGGYGLLQAGAGLQRGAGLAGDGGIRDVGYGDGLGAAIECFALRGGGVRGFAGLGDDYHDGIGV